MIVRKRVFRNASNGFYAPYSTACYVILALGIAWEVTRLLWPASAAALFRRRAGAQLALCAQTVQKLAHGDPSARRHRAAALPSAYANQLAQVAPLHEQARLEPVESALDEKRRAELLALMQDLFDQALQARESQPAQPTSREAAVALEPLLDALRCQDVALAASMDSATRALGQAPIEPEPRLREAHADVGARLEELRTRSRIAGAIGTSRTEVFLATIAERRTLVASQLALEAWMADWRTALAAENAA